MRALRLSSFALICFALSCSGDPDGSVVIVTGDEPDVFTRAPAPVTLKTEIIAVDGSRSTLSTTNLPETSVDIGSESQDDIGAVAITGFAADGITPLVKGESLLVQWGALSSQNLLIFAQRTNEMAHVPSGPGAFDATQSVVVEGRFILETNGTTTQLYDLFSFSTLDAPTLPQAAKSIAEYGSSALLIDENGATGIDLETGDTTAIDAPTGGTYSEVAGGAHIEASDSSQFIVGGTRIGGAGVSVRALEIDDTGAPSFVTFNSPRQGACAAYVTGHGLVVYGGAAAPASGVEVLDPSATVASNYNYPADPVQGCGAAALDNQTVLIVGTDGGPAKTIDLTCSSNCVPQLWTGNIPVVNAEVTALSTTVALVVGNDAAGVTHAYHVEKSFVREIPLKDPTRKNAHLLPGPADGTYIVGGSIAGIESYRE